jgi:folate-binding protein YgfZ
MAGMTDPIVARLDSRALIALDGDDWRSFLQGLITQDVETLEDGEVRFGALLTPQGRLLHDLFLHGRPDGCLIDCVADQRGGLMARLTMYRLRAKVRIAPDERPVMAMWGKAEASPPSGWAPDPRLPKLGWRAAGAPRPPGVTAADEADYDVHRLALGVPGPQDFGSDRAYAIEADFDLLNGVDFRKGCFVGQETTSRMKRRGQIRSRMVPIVFEGAAVAPGTELLCGTLRAGEALSSMAGRAIALLRLDRLDGAPLTLADGRAWRADWPGWLTSEPATPS